MMEASGLRPGAANLTQFRKTRRTDALFSALSTDFLLREQFVTEPTQLLAEYVHGRKVPVEQAEVVDQLLYSVLASDALLEWFQDYADSTGGQQPPRDEMVRDFTQAVVDTGARHVVVALARASVERPDVLDADVDVLALLYKAVAGLRTSPATGPERSGGTMMTTGHETGTMVSTAHHPGAVFNPGDVLATEASGGTMMTTGHETGTMVSTAHHPGGVFGRFSGVTEQSTGHTTGTDKSTDHFVGREVFGEGLHRATFAALVDYAARLRDMGALDVVYARAGEVR